MTNREFIIENEDPDFAGELVISEEALINQFVICGFIDPCPQSGKDCYACQRSWLDAEHIDYPTHAAV